MYTGECVDVTAVTQRVIDQEVGGATAAAVHAGPVVADLDLVAPHSGWDTGQFVKGHVIRCNILCTRGVHHKFGDVLLKEMKEIPCKYLYLKKNHD